MTRYPTLCLLLLSIVTLLGSPSAYADILVIESYHKEYAWDESYRRALDEHLGKTHTLHYFQMDTKRLPVEQFAKQAEAAWQAYQTINPELVILADDNALRFLGPRLGHTQTPVVYLGINRNPREYGVHRFNNITGVLERPLLRRSIVSIKKLMPKAENVLVMFDAGTTSQAAVEGIFASRHLLDTSGVHTQLRVYKHWSRWQRSVLKAREEGFDAIIVGLYHTLVDDEGQHVDANKVMSWTSQHNQLPLFSFWDFAIGPEKTAGGWCCRDTSKAVWPRPSPRRSSTAPHRNRSAPLPANRAPLSTVDPNWPGSI